MSLAIVYSRASSGIAAPLVTVEVHISQGTAGWHLVGLPEAAVRESKERVRSALVNARFDIPCARIIINLAPADLPKEGGRFDLPIALGVLAASGQLPAGAVADYEFVGELALNGKLRGVQGILPAVLAAMRADRRLIVAQQNANEAALVEKAQALSAVSLLQVYEHLRGKNALPVCTTPLLSTPVTNLVDLADVKGQPHAKRALEIAAAGQHSLLYLGPPGTGKTMLASRLPSILPIIDEEQALEVAAVASVSSVGFDSKQWRRVPFRSPHHSSSAAALVGGGRPPRPGEVSLAHHGVLFLDELPEFTRHALECLREPMESGHVTISRAAYQTLYPAKFQLIASMNPCPCGHAGSTTTHCRCSPEQVRKYMNKISGPLLDRIDMHVEVARLSSDTLANTSLKAESSELVRERVLMARAVQQARQGKTNAALSVPELEAHANVTAGGKALMTHIMAKFSLSARGYHRLLRVARTIADLQGCVYIDEDQVSEVIQYRCLDKTHMYKN